MTSLVNLLTASGLGDVTTKTIDHCVGNELYGVVPRYRSNIHVLRSSPIKETINPRGFVFT